MSRRRTHPVVPLVAVLVILTLLPVNLLGQSVYGSIAGVVTDPSGAAVPATAVTLTNLATAERRTLQSDGEGNYKFVNILPGKYRLEAEKSGFKLFRRDPIEVQIESGLKIDIAMQVGAVGDVVEVTAETPLLQPQTSSLGQVVEARSVTELPLNGRNPLALVALVPGVVPQGNPAAGNSSTGGPVGANPFAVGAFQIGGGQAGQSQILLDGVATNGAYLNVVTVVPTQDAIQEFKVQTNNLGPEFGRFAGGVVNLTTKSGGNAFHGTAYEFLRNRVLNSKEYFAADTAPFTQNQFGFNLGGRVVRDKLFFFTSYEGFRLRKGKTFTATVPTLQERGGDFSDFGLPIYDPLTSGGPAACSGSNPVCRDQFAGNVIPSGRIDATALALLGYFPEPNQPGLADNFVTNQSVGGDINQYNERIDYNLSEKQRIFGRFTWWKMKSLPDNPFTLVCSDRCAEDTNSRQIALADTLTLSPRTVLDLHLGYTRFVYVRTPLSEGIDLSQFGPNWGSLGSQFAYTHLPVACISQTPGDNHWGQSWCSNGTGSGIGAYDDTWSFTPSLSRIMGSHTIKVGGELRVLRNNYFQTNQPAGSFNFNATMTAANPFINPGATSGIGFASFLLGYGVNKNDAVVTPSRMATQLLYKAFYVGDTFQATHKLTLNLGVRVDLQGSWTERYDRIIDFLPNGTSPLADGSLINPVTMQSFANLKGAFALVNSPQRSSRSSLDAWNHVSPRIGLTYQLDNKTVLRTGYGMFYLPVDVRWNDAPHNMFINTYAQTWQAVDPTGTAPLNVLSNPFPAGIIQPPGRDQAWIDVQGSGVGGPISNNPAPYVQQWNLNIQRELPGNTLIDVAYAGSKGTHLPMHSQDLNQLRPEDTPTNQAEADFLRSTVTNPFKDVVQSGSLAGQDFTTVGQMLRPYPQYDGVSVSEPNNRDSIYHSMQLKVQKRFSGGASVLASYTVAKLIDNTTSEINWIESSSPNWGDANANNISGERSLDPFDVPQRLVISSVLDLPFGKGKRFASNLSPVADKILGGWGVDAILTFQSGFPLTMAGCPGVLNSVPNAGCPRAIRTGVPKLTSGSLQERLDKWFDTSAFSFNDQYNYGNDSRTEPSIRSDGTKSVDFAAFKNVKFGPDERLNLQFRTEFFNLFNRTQFNAPNTSVGSPDFGRVTSQYNLPRVIQFALRFSF